MRKLRLHIGITVFVALLVGTLTAQANGTVEPLVLVSGPSPFAACTAGGTPDGLIYLNAEVEPRVAVNPANPSNIIGVYQQDRWSDGGSHGLVTAYSFDGGATWRTTWPYFSVCAGGTSANGGNYDRASDPWVSIGPDGTAYQISLSASSDLVTSAILASRSTDGGATWSEPYTIVRDDSSFNFNDKESITADPGRPGVAYAIWDRSNFPSDKAGLVAALHSFAFRADPVFSRTTNGGLTWSPVRNLLPKKNNTWTIGHQIVVTPKGTLVDAFDMFQGSGVQPSPNPFTVSLLRSTDAGATWSAKPIDIAQNRSTTVLDPDTGAEIRDGGMPDVAVDPIGGTIYVVWADSRFSGGAHDDIALSVSTDDGLTWSAPVKINATPNGAAAFTPSIQVSSNGTVGVTYYDFRNNTPDAGLPTDAWFTSCSSACGDPTHWSELHLAGSFDIEKAPYAGGYFLGDYQGLAVSDNTFLPFFVKATGDTTTRTDVFATRVTP